MSEPTRTYKNAEIAVEWRAELCVHCGECASGLPKVFDVDARPWINLEGASSQEIKEQVYKCPSSALKYRDLTNLEETCER
jgi:putative redox protein